MEVVNTEIKKRKESELNYRQINRNKGSILKELEVGRNKEINKKKEWREQDMKGNETKHFHVSHECGRPINK